MVWLLFEGWWPQQSKSGGIRVLTWQRIWAANSIVVDYFGKLPSPQPLSLKFSLPFSRTWLIEIQAATVGDASFIRVCPGAGTAAITSHRARSSLGNDISHRSFTAGKFTGGAMRSRSICLLCAASVAVKGSPPAMITEPITLLRQDATFRSNQTLAISPEDPDVAFPTYREHGAAWCRGVDPFNLFVEDTISVELSDSCQNENRDFSIRRG